MSTPKQTAANRRNAQESTGPKSKAGKAKASINGIRHGILAVAEMRLPWESSDDLAELHQGMIEDWHPRGFTERALVESMVGDMFRMRRLQRTELGVEANNALAVASERMEEERHKGKRYEWIAWGPPMFTEQPSDQAASEEPGGDVYFHRPTAEDFGQAFVNDIKGPDALARLRRYWTSLQNSFYKAMHELEQLQERRGAQRTAGHLRKAA